MESSTAQEKQLLTVIKLEWRSLSDIYRSFGVWVRRYAAMPSEAEYVDPRSFPEAVWFLDENGLKQENVWKWVRFVTMRDFALSNYDAGRRTFSIGLVALAPYAEEERCYMETIWGNRWGMGSQVRFHSDGRAYRAERLWVS